MVLPLAPRADQPLIDGAESLFPALRGLYLSASEANVYADARSHAVRYQVEAEKLNDIENRSRSQGEALDDEMVRRISSFLKSYGEMRRGEEFVMREVRARARERIRFVTGGVLLVLALMVAPLPWQQLFSRRAPG